ncbi:MAG: sel1 repeat family protein [Oceanicaulis sp.]|nr:sel1 repeat family protein [Oceanicaulis sp.]
MIAPESDADGQGQFSEGRMSAFSKPVLAKLVALAAMLAALTAAAAEAQRAPLERDGWRHGAIHNGRQNMPVILPGVAGQWSGSCAGGDAVACTRLADAFTDGHGDIRPNLSIAVGYRLAACRAGSGPSCAIAAALIRSGEAGYVDHALAAATAQTGCETRRDAESCALLGASLHAGEGIARDPARAQALWRDACTRGSSEACRLDAEARLHAGDADSAFAAFREACAAGRAWGCGRLAAAHRTGQGAAPDPAAAADYAARGCQPDRGESDPAACAHHGYFLSRSGDRDEVGRGSMLLTRSCLAGIAEACFEAGELGRRNPPGSRLAAWEVALSYRDGCDLSHGPSCHGLGRLYLQGAGDIRRDQSRAIALIDHACTWATRPPAAAPRPWARWPKTPAAARCRFIPRAPPPNRSPLRWIWCGAGRARRALRPSRG